MINRYEDVECIPYDDAPEEWSDRCSGDGYARYVDENGERRFADNGLSVGIGYRPCAKCGEYPNRQGDDACLGHLGHVVNACCGHGAHEGYIQFDNGVTIRGHFTIERDKDARECQAENDRAGGNTVTERMRDHIERVLETALIFIGKDEYGRALTCTDEAHDALQDEIHPVCETCKLLDRGGGLKHVISGGDPGRGDYTDETWVPKNYCPECGRRKRQ